MVLALDGLARAIAAAPEQKPCQLLAVQVARLQDGVVNPKRVAVGDDELLEVREVEVAVVVVDFVVDMRAKRSRPRLPSDLRAPEGRLGGV